MNPLMQKDCQRKSWAALLSLVGREIRRSKLRKLGIQRTMTMETKHEEMAHDEKYAGYAPETADETGKYMMLMELLINLTLTMKLNFQARRRSCIHSMIDFMRASRTIKFTTFLLVYILSVSKQFQL
ncbi:hypothetical protein OIU77_022178 [Salix suchowensis]|uniref:Uncharacterized protein n=1 Tax=Salix suchowensis TaxID=1278906 RepID=A0ABQ9C126_9ROSI|nr:hypothetical protein OIU77_022178 [Salix suchowensis]